MQITTSTNAPLCLTQFTAFLRKHKIDYKKCHHFVWVNHYQLNFLPQSERILISAGFDVPFTYSFPFCSPETIVKKTLAFHCAVTGGLKCPKVFLPVK